MQLSLYLHFPFCKSKCVYCDFCSFAAREASMEPYCGCLMREMELYAAEYGGAEIATLYFGGGTPSIIPAPLMREVLQKLRACFLIPQNIEFTSEANPGTVTDEWLQTMAAGGVNRLSIGVQARQDRLLRLLGRIHTFPQAEETLQMARRHGITNLSTDLMYGLPTQTLGNYLDSIRAVADLGVQHISAYALKVEDGTRLQAMVKSGEADLPGEDETADMMDAGIELLESLGYRRYEISNFAKPGFRSQHNLRYWRQAYYLGLGLNAASMLPPRGGEAYLRQSNTDDFETYRRRLTAGLPPVEESEAIGRREAMFETVMLGLRTTAGVGRADFRRMHGMAIEAAYPEALQALRDSGWLQPENPADPHIALNARGLAMQNTALMPFLDVK